MINSIVVFPLMEVKENKNVTKHRRKFCYMHYKIRISITLKMHAPLSMIKSRKLRKREPFFSARILSPTSYEHPKYKDGEHVWTRCAVPRFLSEQTLAPQSLKFMKKLQSSTGEIQ